MFSKAQPGARSSQVDDVLRAWRTRAVTIILYVMAAAALPGYLIVLTDVLRTGAWLRLGMVSFVCLLLIVMAINRGFDYRLRGWVIVSIAYITAISQFNYAGLESIGRIYLLATPPCALILVGNRAGLIATAFSTVIFGAYFLFAYSGILEG